MTRRATARTATGTQENQLQEIPVSLSDMSPSPARGAYSGPGFWERFWRSSGIQSVGLFILAYAVYGYQPPVDAPADALLAFYDGKRTLILIAAVLGSLATLNLMWFVA